MDARQTKKEHSANGGRNRQGKMEEKKVEKYKTISTTPDDWTSLGEKKIETHKILIS